MVKIFELKQYQKDFVEFAIKNNMLYFGSNLHLKDERPTPYFFNIGAISDNGLLCELGSFYAAAAVEDMGDENIWMGPSYKGNPIVFSAAMMAKLNHGVQVSVDIDRKEAKTHGDASGAKKLFVTDAMGKFESPVLSVFDDVMTSAKTKEEFVEKIYAEAKSKGYNRPIITRIIVGLDREQTMPVYEYPDEVEGKRMPYIQKGNDALTTFVNDYGIKVQSIVGATEAIAYAHQEELLDIDGNIAVTDMNVCDFVNYQKTYGAKRADAAVKSLARQIT